MLTANYEYSRTKADKLPLLVKMQLSWKLKTFSGIFIAFFDSAWNFEHFEQKKKKKNPAHRSHISEVIDSHGRAYLNG